MPSLESVTNEMNEGVRAHYASGHFDLETALTRIQNGGFVPVSRARAAEILAEPIDARVVMDCTGRDVTDEQIAARMAEVSA